MTADLAGDPGPAPPEPAAGTRRRQTVLRVAVPVGLTVAVGLFVAYVSPRSGWHGEFDLKVYRGAAVWWLDHQPLYAFRHPASPYGFTYPPFAALTMLPWA